MSEYVKSRDFHKVLRNIWDPCFKPLGFKRCKGSVASYYRPRHDNNGFLRFWVQVSQWGDSWSGNSFTLNLDISVTDPNGVFAGSRRFLGELSAEQLAEAERITEEVRKRKPKPPTGHWIYPEMADGAKDSQLWKKAFARAFTYSPGTLKPKCDIWFDYFSVADVTCWAEFLAPLLPQLLDELEKT
jgi:hypothetical protein